MAFENLRTDVVNETDTRVVHAQLHNDLADRINYLLALYGEGQIGLPPGGFTGNVLTIKSGKTVGWRGSRQVTPGGRPGMVQQLVDKDPKKWDWRVPKNAGDYPSQPRENIDDPDSFGPLQGFWIIDENDPLDEDQWGQNGDLWMVYDPEVEQ
jgi:hypothetical protein